MRGPTAAAAAAALLPLGKPIPPVQSLTPALAHGHHDAAKIDPGVPIDWIMYLHVRRILLLELES